MIRSFKPIACICFVLLSPSACSLFHMSPVRVISYSPSENYVEDLSELSVVLTFSSDMNRTATEDAFSFSADGDEREGDFIWEGKSLTFVPFYLPGEYRNFTITLAARAEDKYGNNIEEEFSHRFSRRTERIRPYVAEVFPADGSVTDDLHPVVEVLFSEAMDKASVQHGFSIDPDTEGIFSWKAGENGFSYRPKVELIWQREYTVTLDSEISDLHGNGLGDEYSFTFSVGSDSVPPAVQFVENAGGDLYLSPDDPDDGIMTLSSGWECFWDLSITFSEPVEREGIGNYLHISPPADFSIEGTADAFVQSVECMFDEPLAYDEMYTLTVEEGIIDRFGNTMLESVVYRFRSDGAMSLPPEIKLLTFLDDPGGPPPTIGPYSAYDSINLNNYTSGPMDGFFDIYFDAAAAAEPDLLSFTDNFSLSLDSSGALSIRVIGIEIGTETTPPNIAPPPFPAVSSGEYLFRVHVEIDNAEASTGILTLRLGSDYSDSTGNEMESEWVYILNTATP